MPCRSGVFRLAHFAGEAAVHLLELPADMSWIAKPPGVRDFVHAPASLRRVLPFRCASAPLRSHADKPAPSMPASAPTTASLTRGWRPALHCCKNSRRQASKAKLVPPRSEPSCLTSRVQAKPGHAIREEMLELSVGQARGHAFGLGQKRNDEITRTHSAALPL